jgi:hypothetical protein
MSIVPVHRPVSQRTVVRIVDLEGATTTVVCDEFDSVTRTCRMKRRVDDNGPLSRLLERVSEHTLDRRSTQCDFT